MFTSNPVKPQQVKRHVLFTPYYVGSVAMLANELYAENLAQLPYLSIIPAHYV